MRVEISGTHNELRRSLEKVIILTGRIEDKKDKGKHIQNNNNVKMDVRTKGVEGSKKQTFLGDAKDRNLWRAMTTHVRKGHDT